MKISVVMPVYNEKDTIREIIRKVQGVHFDKEVIVVDDCSTDGTREILMQEFDNTGIKIVCHDKNKGKGAALRTGFKQVSGDIIIIQDADLEYDPKDYAEIIEMFSDGKTDVVYGSRFLGRHRDFMFFHFLGNKFLNLVANILYDTILSDMETGYKAFRREILNDLQFKSNGFEFEAEFTAKVFKKKYRVYEVPITYRGRTYIEGKKITWGDGFAALYALLKYRFVD